MNLIEQIKEIISKLDEIESYNQSLGDNLLECDNQTQDILHYIENNKVPNFLETYRLVKKIKEIRIARRKIKQDIELSKKYSEQRNKLISTSECRSLMLNEMYKKEKSLDTEYKNRYYEDGDIKNILKGV